MYNLRNIILMHTLPLTCQILPNLDLTSFPSTIIFVQQLENMGDFDNADTEGGWQQTLNCINCLYLQQAENIRSHSSCISYNSCSEQGGILASYLKCQRKKGLLIVIIGLISE